MTSNQESKDIIDALGGKRGILDSGIPSLVFVLDFTWTRNLGQALLIAVSLAVDRKSTRLNSSHIPLSRMPSSA